ncbi:hypothetical protein AVEN_199465-1 [Araneus ventricosus]|uniref:Uncharacterized protein n=1 Tax=Araneus ventricosus TaxID=182803 RepID=A0A4Y2LFC1_ARAVE|nr:hypothetical protein AVEN_199465-1 [Araneus ventricosus]
MRPTSPEADNLRQEVLIVIDEITMLTKDGLRCVDSLLRGLMNNDKPFGGSFEASSLATRCAVQTEYSMWLLNIGSGTLAEISGLPCDSIEIPQQMVVEKLTEAIYSKNLKDMEVEQLAKRVISAPTNKKTLEMNR